MIQRRILVSIVLVIPALAASDLLAQCEGSASAATTYTQHFNCSDPRKALQWTLNIACVNACGQVWWTLPPQQGSADGACDQLVRNFCSPQWYRYSYTNGLYAETSAFPGKLFAGCKLEDIPVTTASDCPCAPPCEGPSKPPKPKPCSEPVPGEVAVLGLAGSPSGDLQSMGRDLFSGRVEEADGLQYVMEDWAVVGLDAAGAAKVLSPGVVGGSSPRPAPKRFASLGGEYSGSPSELASIGLVIAPPHHPRNSRHIPAPAIALRPARLPDPGERITAAVRIDVGEDRAIRDAQLLYSVGRLPSGIDLAKEVRNHLDVRYASEQQHRVVVFAIVDVEGGGMELRDSEIVLPLCCCYPICK